MSVHIDDMEVAYSEVGRGDPLVLIHGLGDDHRAWRRTIPDLMLHRRVILYDLRGHGQTTLGTPHGTLRQLSNDLLQFLDAVNLEQVDIAGFSLGGTVAMRFAIDFPLDVRGLVLVATSSRVGRAAADWYRQRVDMVERGDPQLRETLDRDTVDVHAESPQELEEVLLIRRQSTADPRGYARASAVILRGAGTQAFSSGYDLSLLTGTVDDLEADRHIGEAAAALRACPTPVIARLQGHCHGAAVELALNCDLRIAAADLRLSVPAVSLGVVYRFQFLARLVQICGIARASDLLLAMPELDAERASAWGLVTEVLPASKLDKRIQALAEMLAMSPRPAVHGTKASLDLLARRGVSGEDLLLAQQLRADAAASPERREAVTRRKQSMSKRSNRKST